MTSTKPKVYSGTGSAVDNYQNPKKELQNIVKGVKNYSQDNWGLFDKTNLQHKTILSQLRTLEWTIPHERHGDVADISRLSDFLKSDKAPINKPLMDMDKTELSKTIECFKSMVRKNYK